MRQRTKPGGPLNVLWLYGDSIINTYPCSISMATGCRSTTERQRVKGCADGGEWGLLLTAKMGSHLSLTFSERHERMLSFRAGESRAFFTATGPTGLWWIQKTQFTQNLQFILHVKTLQSNNLDKGKIEEMHNKKCK